MRPPKEEVSVITSYSIHYTKLYDPDENFRILLDAKDISESRLWQLLSQRLPLDAYTRNGDMIPPLARGLGLTLLPRPQRYYFGFGRRIRTSHSYNFV